MDNINDFNKKDNFLEEIKKSFIFVLKNKNGNRSSKKIDEIHNLVANHLQELLGDEYIVKTKLKTGKEEKIKGRYFDKRVDILVERVFDNKPLAGIGVKSIISSYGKNKNNYFENMLGETANIRSNNIPYFQIVILPFMSPDFTTDNQIKSYTILDENKLFLYKKLSEDDSLSFFHTPIKTLLIIVDYFPSFSKIKINKKEYENFYIENNNKNNLKVKTYNLSTIDFDDSLILNNYELFLQKITYLVKGFN